MTTKPFHSSMRVACSALLPSILAAVGVVLAAPQPGVADKKAADDGSIFEAVEDETMVRLTRILDADPNAWKARNGVKNQPLHLAAEEGNNGAVGLLLERGADVTARGDGGWTALHYAAEEGHPETCRILLKAGAKRGALCDFGLKAMDYAKDPNTLLALKSDNILVPGVKDFLSAVGDGDLETVQTMLKSTPDLLNAKGAQGKTAVMEAAAHNRVELLKWLIEAGADIDLMTEEDVTALHLATTNGQVETVKLLLDHEVEVNPAPANESEQRATESPLSLATTFMVVSVRGTRATSATAEGDPERENLNNIFSDGTEKNAATEVFKSMFQDVEEPLRSRRTEIAKLLIAAGAKPDIKGRGAPLVAASAGRQVEIVRLLLEAGADPNRRMGGVTPLIFSVYMQAPEAQFRLLLEKGADPHLPTREPKDPGNGKEPDSPDGSSTLEFTASMGEVASFRVMFDSLDTTKLSDKQKTALLWIAIRNPELLKIVLAAGFDVNLANEEKRTALHYAVFEGAESVRMLLEAGADVKVRDITGYMPIHYAAEKGSTEKVEILLAKDPSQIESTTGGDTTPLIHACGRGDNAETVALLIGKGANMEAAFGPDKMTALMYCALLGRADSADVLIKAGADIKVTSNAHGLLGTAAGCGSFYADLVASNGAANSKPGAKEDYLRIAELLIELGADVNQLGDGKGKGWLPLAKASRSGSVAMVKLLLKHGADANIANKNDAGRNPLWVTIELGDMELFGLILDEIDDVDAKDVAQNTPLHYAATMDQPEMVKALLKRGARINAREKNGATPLMMAVAFSARKSARTLLEAGADRTIPDRVEVTPMQRAEQLNDAEMINMLIAVQVNPKLPPVPAGLLDDPHFREELALNEFTAPSIARIFESLEALAPLPMADFQRKIPARMPLDRADIAVELGFLIADGFLIVQAGELGKVPDLAAHLTRYGKALGGVDQVDRHAASLLQSARDGKVDQLKVELSATQRDVELELVKLRDADLAHLISLGGWIRALEVASGAVDKQFSEDRARKIMREDIADYYASVVSSLEPRIAERPNYVALHHQLVAMQTAMTIPEGQDPTKEQVAKMRKQAAKLVELALKRGEEP